MASDRYRRRAVTSAGRRAAAARRIRPACACQPPGRAVDGFGLRVGGSANDANVEKPQNIQVMGNSPRAYRNFTTNGIPPRAMNDLAAARRHVELIGRHLPSSINAARFGVRSKAPYLLLCAREPLFRRTEELARCACDMLERDDLAAGIMLTRGVTESAAFVWRLNQLLEDRKKYSEADLLRRFEQMLLGSKNTNNDDFDFPKAINIITMIAHLDKRFPGIKDGYYQLSEFVHPDWSGVFGLFSMTDWRTHTTKFTGTRGIWLRRRWPRKK
jgi:hypothetical protein